VEGIAHGVGRIGNGMEWWACQDMRLYGVVVPASLGVGPPPGYLCHRRWEDMHTARLWVMCEMGLGAEGGLSRHIRMNG
jgi:hypothetical protein